MFLKLKYKFLEISDLFIYISKFLSTSCIYSLHTHVAIGTAYWHLEHVSVMVLFQTYWQEGCLLVTTAVMQCGGGCNVLRSTSPW